MTDDNDYGFPMWTFIILGIFLLFMFVWAGTMIYEEVASNTICRDNGWDRAVVQSSGIIITKYVCQNIIKDKWTTHTVNSTDAFEVDKYKINPGKIE